MAARYKHYYGNFRKVVLDGDLLAGVLLERGEKVAAAAREATPLGDERGGHIRDHYKVSLEKGVGPNHYGIGAVVYNDHPAAAAYELGHLTTNGKPVAAANKLRDAMQAAKS